MYQRNCLDQASYFRNAHGLNYIIYFRKNYLKIYVYCASETVLIKFN